MSRLPQPQGEFDDAAGLWVLKVPFEIRLSGGRTLYVTSGFVSDGASIPRFLWSLPFAGPRYHPKTFASAFVHDALYASELLPRKECDLEFKRLLIMAGAGFTRSRTYYLSVRSFGWAVWMGHSKGSVAEARGFVSLR
jgi:hypothetical protein